MIKKVIGAAAPKAQTEDPTSVHDSATGVEGGMDDTGAPGLTRMRGDFGVSGLTPGREPVTQYIYCGNARVKIKHCSQK